MKLTKPIRSKFRSSLALICTAMGLAAISGCAAGPRVSNVKLAKAEARLRRANLKIEDLRERNWVLRKRVRILEESGASDPAFRASESLRAFDSQAQRVNASDRKSRAAKNSAVGSAVGSAGGPKAAATGIVAAPEQIAVQDSADRVLARTLTELLKSGDVLEAERTAMLLEKSYPDSELVAESRFQLGLFFFRKRDFGRADAYFKSTLAASSIHLRARAGASLMRGIIAAHRDNPKPNKEFAKLSFQYVKRVFPSTPEARRASRELASPALAEVK